MNKIENSIVQNSLHFKEPSKIKICVANCWGSCWGKVLTIYQKLSDKLFDIKKLSQTKIYLTASRHFFALTLLHDKK